MIKTAPTRVKIALHVVFDCRTASDPAMMSLTIYAVE